MIGIKMLGLKIHIGIVEKHRREELYLKFW